MKVHKKILIKILLSDKEAAIKEYPLLDFVFIKMYVSVYTKKL